MNRNASTIGWIIFCGCGGAREPQRTELGAAPPVMLDQRFVETIREAATAYTAWGRVDQDPKVAPELCAPPPAARDSSSNGEVRLSTAGADTPHGRKLYYLYAKDRAAYLGLSHGLGETLPISFAVVKEAFAPRTTTKDAARSMNHGFVEHDGAYLVPDAAAGLFVMAKVGEAAEPGTDEGWVYGTIATDGAVTSAGRVATCMSCHVGEATRERLFGLREGRGNVLD